MSVNQMFGYFFYLILFTNCIKCLLLGLIMVASLHCQQGERPDTHC